MSIALMTEAWRSDLPTGRKMVLLSLCDNASDQGECYPSIDSIAKRCGMTDRSVYSHLAALETMGMLVRQDRHGRSNLYRLNPCKFCTPETISPLKPFQVTPETISPPPEMVSPSTPETISPITIIEPSLNRQVKQKSAMTRVEIASKAFGLSDVDQQVLDDYLAFRKKRKADLTATVVADLRAQAELAGLSLTAAMRLQLRRGWTGFEAAWVAAGAQGAQRGGSAPVESFAERKSRAAAQRFEEFRGGRSQGAATPLQPADVIDVPAIEKDQP
jgi:DNA-binding transcriptional ArsR family regulator